MAHLLFDPTEFLNELHDFKELSAGFLSHDSFALDSLEQVIQGLVARGAGEETLEIPEKQPLRTRISAGEFEPGHKSSTREVFADVTGIWQIELVERRIRDPRRPARKVKPKAFIGFIGLASAVIEVFDRRTLDTLALWKMEVGDSISPGCFFHTFASIDKNLPTPRHPNLFPTPMSAIGFALGELFQDEWEKVVSGTGHHSNSWRSIQKRRLSALLRWQMDFVSATASSSPWMDLKAAKPDPAIFVFPR